MELLAGLLVAIALASFIGVIYSIIQVIRNHKKYINQLKQKNND